MLVPFLRDTFSLCPDAAAIARFLILEDATAAFPFAAQARIAYVLQQPMLLLHGEPAQAYIATARVQGSNRLLWSFLAAQFGQPELFELDFVVYLDAAVWDMLGRDLEPGVSGYPVQREALIYHELCHLRHSHTGEGEPRFGEDGRPLLALTRHTYEFFQAEILRYGPVTLELDQVGLDFVEGAKRERTRKARLGLRRA